MSDLDVTDEDLAQLISDLDAMEQYFKRKIERMDGLLDLVGNNWRGSTAKAFKELQRGVTEDARTVRESLILIEEAVKMSRDGFTAQELETLQKFRSLQSSVAGSDRLLDMADANPQANAPKSRLSEL
ncbi:WXG100 family type VII secretion target [Streptomyces reniochalinae]|uniref:WXG100 family type VII secretion target n=1 Tax=Streptomyces reniochalinae TaxID=2250578 RepID=UPI0015F03FE2|nr:WXG100 family type VII secretion target [Streptomyces reniochalinae]